MTSHEGTIRYLSEATKRMFACDEVAQRVAAKCSTTGNGS